MFRSAVLLMVVAVLAVSGCRTTQLQNPQNVGFASAATTTKALRMVDVKNAIVRAGAKRGWTFSQEAPGHLVGNVTVRGKHYVEVDLLFDTEAFSINYRNSRNMNYSAEGPSIHPNYNSWIGLLQQDIQKEVTILKTT